MEQLLDCSSSSSNNSLSLDEKLRWLRQFVPDTLAVLPIALPAVASWTLEVKENIAYRIQYRKSLVLKATGTCYLFKAFASVFLPHPHLKYIGTYMFILVSISRCDTLQCVIALVVLGGGGGGRGGGVIGCTMHIQGQYRYPCSPISRKPPRKGVGVGP